MGYNYFYSSGLKFSCKRCSSCCRHESGYVYLSENDLINLQKAVKTDRKTFIDSYCRWVYGWDGEKVLSLKEKNNKDCVLWENGCTVYNYRPLQCVTFPFWENIVASKESWEIAAGGCPGMNSGELHSESSIKEKVKSRLTRPIITKDTEIITDKKHFMDGRS
ncbi:MAG: YkgJ family cysteine cluster protein [Treponema sp.]|nr:YkgJ family cysteine cluster protein [Treponema sp.]